MTAHTSHKPTQLSDEVRQAIQPLRGHTTDYNTLLDRVGDARATDMGAQGELNVGQLVRQRYGDRAVLVGFTTYTGTVAAASNWDTPVELKHVRPGLPDSYEALFHTADFERFLLIMSTSKTVQQQLGQSRLERAIGVIYRPGIERLSHYFMAQLPVQFDAVIHIDNSQAVEPLDQIQLIDREVPETYPSTF